ncbi:hypothetical protein [Streptomyces aidingensis]|uniref:hypothetical protein n=1 Tax=Streptomyces aidingensis TaxID=910347 RepID=UPI001587BCEB|nr:hypothetical protein [Streptomyces aidingensis]
MADTSAAQGQETPSSTGTGTGTVTVPAQLPSWRCWICGSTVPYGVPRCPNRH